MNKIWKSIAIIGVLLAVIGIARMMVLGEVDESGVFPLCGGLAMLVVWRLGSWLSG